VTTPSSARCCRRDGTLWVETLLVAPVVGLLLLGVLEVRHALTVEARLARAAHRAAHRVAEAGVDATGAERVAVSTELSVAETSVRIDTHEQPGERAVRVTVPYAETGSTLAFLWPTAKVTGESREVR